MHSSRFIFLFIILFFSMEAASATEIQRLMQENRLLKSEYQLARTSQIYILFDLVGKKVQMKARGILLKELPVEKFNLWGASVQPAPLILRKKATLLKPKRIRIKPKKNNEDTSSDIQVFEVEDMPVRYRLDFDNGIHLYIRPKPEGVRSGILTLFSHLKSYGVTMPLGTLWNALGKKTFTELNIYLSPEDARALYWAMPEGSPCVIYAFPDTGQ